MFCRYTFAALVLLAASPRSQAQDTVAVGTLAAVPAGLNADPTFAEEEVREQTRRGELDYTKMLAARKQNVFLHEGHMYSKGEYALVLWAMRAKALGVTSAERACAIYAAATKRTLSAAEKKAISNGFESGTRE